MPPSAAVPCRGSELTTAVGTPSTPLPPKHHCAELHRGRLQTLLGSRRHRSPLATRIPFVLAANDKLLRHREAEIAAAADVGSQFVQTIESTHFSIGLPWPRDPYTNQHA